MAKMPRGAKLIYNPSSAAPGFMTKNVLSLPGVPSILNSMIEKSAKIVFAWGNCKENPLWIEHIVKAPLCFGHNKNGSPKHPLYLPKSTRLISFF